MNELIPRPWRGFFFFSTSFGFGIAHDAPHWFELQPAEAIGIAQESSAAAMLRRRSPVGTRARGGGGRHGERLGTRRHPPPISQEHHDGIARLHAVQLDDAVHGQIGVRVQLDKGVGAVGDPVDLARRRERRSAG